MHALLCEGRGCMVLHYFHTAAYCIGAAYCSLLHALVQRSACIGAAFCMHWCSLLQPTALVQQCPAHRVWLG
jgi:hypothetical protein